MTFFSASGVAVVAVGLHLRQGSSNGASDHHIDMRTLRCSGIYTTTISSESSNSILAVVLKCNVHGIVLCAAAAPAST